MPITSWFEGSHKSVVLCQTPNSGVSNLVFAGFPLVGGRTAVSIRSLLKNTFSRTEKISDSEYYVFGNNATSIVVIAILCIILATARGKVASFVYSKL